MSRTRSEKTAKIPALFRLGGFTFAPGPMELRDAAGQVVSLRRQSAEVLAVLVGNHGATVPKQQIFDAVWAGAHVTDDSLVQCITDIRRALSDDGHQIIRTAPRRGYRAVASPAPDPDGAGPLPLPARPSIAVLAFDDFSSGQTDAAFGDAIAESVIAELSRFHELFVIARNSSFRFRGVATDVKEISRRLGVRYLLEGSLQQTGTRLRVTVQLIDAVAGDHLWSERYEREVADLFAVQDDIVRRVVATVAQKLITTEGRAARPLSGDGLTALCHHLRGRVAFNKLTPEGNAACLSANRAAIAADPQQPFGYVGLTFGYINGFRWGWSELGRAEALEAARQAAETALEVAPDYYDSHAAMAYVHLQDNDLDRAIARARRVLELNPNDTIGMCDLAEFLGYAGQPAEAETLLRTAMRLDPLHPDWIRWNLAWVQWLDGRGAEALETMNAMSALPPMALRVLALIHVDLGQMEPARAAVQRILDHDPGYSLADVRRNYRGKFRNAADYERVIAGLRAAGVPEKP